MMCCFGPKVLEPPYLKKSLLQSAPVNGCKGCFRSGVVPGHPELLAHIRRSFGPVVGREGRSRPETSQVVEVTYDKAEVVLLKRNEYGVRDHVPPSRATKVKPQAVSPGLAQ